ncbi:hypothetical protein YC2023_086279 [Brassica napus]
MSPISAMMHIDTRKIQKKTSPESNRFCLHIQQSIKRNEVGSSTLTQTSIADFVCALSTSEMKKSNRYCRSITHPNVEIQHWTNITGEPTLDKHFSRRKDGTNVKSKNKHHSQKRQIT